MVWSWSRRNFGGTIWRVFGSHVVWYIRQTTTRTIRCLAASGYLRRSPARSRPGVHSNQVCLGAGIPRGLCRQDAPGGLFCLFHPLFPCRPAVLEDNEVIARQHIPVTDLGGWGVSG